MGDFTVQGAEDLAKLGRGLRNADRELKKNLLRELRAEASPIGKEIRDAYGAKLPRRGGLAARIGKSTVGAKTRTSGKSVGVQVTLRNRHDLRSIERGRLRHPVFGRDESWVDQRVPAGIGAEVFLKHQAALQRRVHAAMERTANTIMKG